MTPETEKRGETVGHTPTPWVLEGESFIFSPVYDSNGVEKCRVHVADTPWFSGMPEDRKANAAFILRAVNSFDDMLKALKRIHETVSISEAPEFDDNYLDQNTREQVAAAIAKAEGRQ